MRLSEGISLLPSTRKNNNSKEVNPPLFFESSTNITTRAWLISKKPGWFTTTANVHLTLPANLSWVTQQPLPRDKTSLCSASSLASRFMEPLDSGVLALGNPLALWPVKYWLRDYPDYTKVPSAPFSTTFPPGTFRQDHLYPLSQP